MTLSWILIAVVSLPFAFMAAIIMRECIYCSAEWKPREEWRLL
jgi:hypothetical protein